MTVRLHPVPLDFVNQTWPAVAGYLAPALALCESGEALYNLDHVRQYVVSGEWELFVVLTEDNQIIAVASDSAVPDCPLPVLDLNEIPTIADFVLQVVDLSSR